MKSKEYIIGGIDTDCGKTYATGVLAKKLQEAGHSLITSKLIQTGSTGISEDIIEHRRLMGMELTNEDLSGQTCPYVLSYPASPHLAAKIDDKEIDLEVLRKSAKTLLKQYEIVLCEAAGGLMVPITNNYCTANYIKDNELTLILVASSKLGSINHTLLSLELCLNYQIDLPLIIYNKLPRNDEIIANDTFTFLCSTVREKLPKTQIIQTGELVNNPQSIIDIFKV